MKSSNLSTKGDDYQYLHIYKIFKKYFLFDSNKYEYLIKDIINVLMEFEKKGETIIDVDKVQINFELYNNNWPEKHIECIYNCQFDSLSNSPIVIQDRKISWSKWITKLERVKKRLLNKMYMKAEENKIIPEKINNIEKINFIFKYSNLVLLEGGPGTGKTTLVINLILNYLKDYSDLNIGLSAPTGKATARIKEALNSKLTLSDFNAGIIECQTLHGWIYNYNNAAKFKLSLRDLDFFVIDECSMVDIDIIEMVLELINTDCKIILVGDAKQLPPINNCSVWNNIFENIEDNLFRDCIVNLKKIYRNNGDIEELSKLIFNEDQKNFNQKVEKIINSKNLSNVNIQILNNKELPNKLKEIVNSFIFSLKLKTIRLSKKKYIFDRNIGNLITHEKELVEDIFETLNSQLILCSRNSGSWSVKDVNSFVIKENEPYDLLCLDEGLPIMCIENNNELGIFNGDIGVLIGKNKSRRFLFRKFNKNNESVFALIDPSRLENVVPAIAVTIHKSQGSESDKVLILWNKENNFNKDDYDPKEFKFFRDNYEKRLLYTGITRAKKNLYIFYLD